ncbi:hypothetical protein JZX76_04310 [Haloarcula hispanica]|uniref:Cox cluster protein n=1 Tax=Haloarcula hispanica TaxID=51589 RepID=A0A482T3D4_HALHI|nr:hypothetical protein [Haloarcula hispanica]MCJ0618770.1 hypothetical protein [Haloarcula hispanica]RYJ09330.1 hypothetical protein ELS20_04310 [Haloarcula hispanica]
MQQHTTVIDKAAMALSGGLMLLGVVVLGIVEILAGKPYSAAPLTNDAGEIIATPMVDPTLRTGLVLAGLIVLALYGVYRLVAPMKTETATTQQEITAD